MSLNKPENRAAFKADEAAYLDRFPLTAEQREAVLKRDWLGMLKVGGNIYYTIKIAFCDGLTFQDVAGMMCGMPKEEYAKMMLAGGRTSRGQPLQGAALVARIVGGIACSHVPAIGAALDKGTAGNPYWEPYFAGIAPAREWMAELKPDVAILVYNDHAYAFRCEIIPDVPVRRGADVPAGRRGLGPAAGARRSSAIRRSPGTSRSR